MAKDSSKNSGAEDNENQFDKSLSNPICNSLSRTPLNVIPDPLQFSKEFLQEFHNGFRDKSVEVGSTSNRRKCDSAHSTPARSASRTTYVGQLGACTGPMALHSAGERGANSSTVSRRISNVNCEPSPTEVPHFELVEDPSFWNDHNVQVLIRIRPLSNMEKMTQGYIRCLKQESPQSLVWLGHPEVRFKFDHIISETIPQEKLFRVAGLPMVDNCMSGYNSCMFAYGQTGSGKTHTMMGEISQRDGKLVDDCGITPRLFEYLFTRIKLEEENRKDERLTYSCKCSFLEIYNEQITDLLEPSSTNLQLREDLKEGVYVENLTEYSVKTVDQVLKLLLQGAANRKVAGTDMNSESSRSHSVFTCIVESRWEKDSVTHLRFGRLNLVDLAGSERQRSSGAGERLKEASYINRSLSTLGLVIMSLVDVAHGKHRHVPYRDSRLTFLLQDSLGGNSKTTIIANVSPSMCAANETLSTLKFAQRAKLIQNNAKVNEDMSGDVIALQRQIQMLKEQILSMKHQRISKPLLQVEPTFQPNLGEAFEKEDPSCENICDANNADGLTNQKQKVEACNQADDKILLENSGLNISHSTNIMEELIETRALLDAMKSQQARLVEELHYVRQENDRLVESLSGSNKAQTHPMLDHESDISENGWLEKQNLASAMDIMADQSMMDLHAMVEKMTEDLENAGLVSNLVNGLSHTSLKDEADLVHEEVDIKAANEILHLQEELASLQVKYQRRLCFMSEENAKLRRIITAKEDEVYTLHTEWEKASLELTSFLLDGSKHLKDASGQIESITHSFPQYNVLVGEHVKKAATVCMEKEHTIVRLEKSLVEAQGTILLMQEKLNSLRTATIALTEVQYTEHAGRTKEACLLSPNLDDKTTVTDFQDDKFMPDEGHICKVVDETKTTFLEAKRPYDHGIAQTDVVRSTFDISTIERKHDSGMNAYANTSALVDFENRVEVAKQALEEAKIAINMSLIDAEMYPSTLQAEILKTSSVYNDLVKDFMKGIYEINKMLVEIKGTNEMEGAESVKTPLEACIHTMQENQLLMMLHQIIAELVSLNSRLDNVKAYLSSVHDQVLFEDLEGCMNDNSTSSSSSILSDDDVPENMLVEGCWELSSGVAEQTPAPVSVGDLLYSSNQASDQKDSDMISLRGVKETHLLLKKQFVTAHDALVKLDVQLASVFMDKKYADHSKADAGFMQSLEAMKLDDEDSSRDVLNALQTPAMSECRPSNLATCKDAAACFTAGKSIAGEKPCKVASFFSKFEQACATVNDADKMLNALLKANEEANELAGRWKQAAEEVMVEKASLVEEIKVLKHGLQLRDEEHAILEEQSSCILVELANSVSMLEGSFWSLQREAEDSCHLIYSDALAMIQGIFHSICKSRSSLEDVCAETLEKSFACFVIQQCHVGEYTNKFKLGANYGFWPSRPHEEIMEQVEALQFGQNLLMNNDVHGEEEEHYSALVARKETGELDASSDVVIGENLKLKKELERKNNLLNGLFFDFSLLQESASTRKDAKDEAEKLCTALSEVQHELKMKTNQLDDMRAKYQRLECCLADTEAALSSSKSCLQHSEETVDALSYQNADFRSLLEDLYHKQLKTEEQLEEQKEIVKSFEKEIHCAASSAQEQFLFSLEGITDDFKRVSSERDQLCEQIKSLQDRLEIAYSIADEQEAIAVEARQESEASKIYAEQKEEEVKILEHSVEELESTINVLEKRVNEMGEEFERHHMIRDSLEVELQSLKQRLVTVESFRDGRNSDNNNVQSEDQIARKLHNRTLELQEAYVRINDLEDERTEQANEIKQCKEYISELVIHAEAQASQYQQKYKSLEAMVSVMKIDSTKFGSEAPLLDKTEKNSVRVRGSGSPFRCIGNLVHQMNTEKDQELSLAKLRLEELDALASSRQKEICVLNTKLAAAESMTHDVIRDLLGVKLDMTNYANLINQNLFRRFIEDAAGQTREFLAMEQEICKLKRQLTDLHEERDRCISEIHRKEADILASKMTVVQLQGKEQLLTAQNEMLKGDKTNLQKRAAELDEMIKKLLQSHQNTSEASCTSDFGRRLANSQKLLVRVNKELGQYRNLDRPDVINSKNQNQIRNRYSSGSGSYFEP